MVASHGNPAVQSVGEQWSGPDNALIQGQADETNTGRDYVNQHFPL